MTTLSAPRLLILDEHTAALDPKTAVKVMDLTAQMIRRHGLTALMVTHNLNQALRYGNRMIMLHCGKIQLDVRDEEKERLTAAAVLDQFGRSLGDETLFSTPRV